MISPGWTVTCVFINTNEFFLLGKEKEKEIVTGRRIEIKIHTLDNSSFPLNSGTMEKLKHKQMSKNI